MKKRVIISLIVAVAVSMCVVLTSCGETNEKSSTPSSSSVEQSDIVSGTESVTEEETLAESTTEKTLAEEDPSEETTEEKEFAGTTKEKASALAITEAKEDGFSETFRVIYAKHTTVKTHNCKKTYSNGSLSLQYTLVNAISKPKKRPPIALKPSPKNVTLSKKWRMAKPLPIKNIEPTTQISAATMLYHVGFSLTNINMKIGIVIQDIFSKKAFLDGSVYLRPVNWKI